MKWFGGPVFQTTLTGLSVFAISIGSVDLGAQDGMVTAATEMSVDSIENRLVAQIRARGLVVFSQIDHGANAATIGQTLQPMRLILFGSPAVGTRLMKCGASIGIDLPLKLLVWRDGETTKVGYNSPTYLSERHSLEGCEVPLAAITEAMDELVQGALNN